MLMKQFHILSRRLARLCGLEREDADYEDEMYEIHVFFCGGRATAVMYDAIFDRFMLSPPSASSVTDSVLIIDHPEQAGRQRWVVTPEGKCGENRQVLNMYPNSMEAANSVMKVAVASYVDAFPSLVDSGLSPLLTERMLSADDVQVIEMECDVVDVLLSYSTVDGQRSWNPILCLEPSLVKEADWDLVEMITSLATSGELSKRIYDLGAQ